LIGSLRSTITRRSEQVISREPLAKLRNPDFKSATVARWGRFFVAGGAIVAARLG
jgi:hypothetical protein